MSVNKDNVVYLGSGHPLHELTVSRMLQNQNALQYIRLLFAEIII